MTDNAKDLTPRTKRGNATRTKLLEAAEQIFSEIGYHDASIVKITEQAGVGLGTFYLYFSGKQAVFEELVSDLNHRVRKAMTEAATAESNRIQAERAGFRAFFKFTAEHPALYRIIRQAEFVAPHSMEDHYQKIVDGYIEGLQRAQAQGEVSRMNPTVAAWALMGIGEMIGMRWVLWEQQRAESDAGFEIPEEVFEEMMQFIERALAPVDSEEQQ